MTAKTLLLSNHSCAGVVSVHLLLLRHRAWADAARQRLPARRMGWCGTNGITLYKFSRSSVCP